MYIKPSVFFFYIYFILIFLLQCVLPVLTYGAETVLHRKCQEDRQPIGKKGPQMVTTFRKKEYRPPSNQVDRRSKEDSGSPLDSEGTGPDGVASITGGLYPAVDFERLMDGWILLISYI